LTLPECWYWIRKLQARVLAGDYSSAIQASGNAQRLLWTSPVFFEFAEYQFYGALAHAASYDSAAADRRQQHFDALTAHYEHLEIWAENCPENFENRSALVAAEIARIEGRDLDAMRLYEQAIRSARANSFVHNEALAKELAARFYTACGFEQIAHLYLRNARDCYLRWGADGKVRQLDAMYPLLRMEEPAPAPTSTIAASVEQLDLATVIKVSQAISGEIVLEKLLEMLMCTALEQAGAERGLLIFSRGAEQRIAAEATTDGDFVTVQLRDEDVDATVLPESVLHYVLRTRESVILDDASSHNPFSADPYIVESYLRSILCLPLINQGKLTGILYLENNLTPRVFTPDRVALLKVLASQAAISLENSRLYRDVADREGKIRRLVDANIIGILIGDREGRILEANDAFLRILGYDREDLVSGRVRWTELSPAEWRERDILTQAELNSTGIVQPFEREYFRKDGSRVPVLIGAAMFKEGGDKRLAFVLDLTERKRAEESLRQSERRYHEAQLELAHANRVATLGQLSASIAHEINQPVAAAVNNASAALRWLGKEPPDLEQARQALNRIFKNGNRVSEVIGRIRALLKKAPLHKEDVDINEAILEVIGLTRGEVTKNGISVQTQLAEGLPFIRGDWVQLQQVILNLIINAVEALSSVGEGPRELIISTGETKSNGVLVAIRDSGPALTQASLERVFDAFYTTKPGGLGMGLSICRSIIEAHDGQLWASVNVPRGAVFQFTVPVHSNRAS
jgi:PAS domain S-box-containing protein